MKYFYVVLLALPLLSQAQKHDYHWVFGYGNSNNNDTTKVNGSVFIDFNESPPHLYKKNIPMNFAANGSTCSDSSGQLLYYSNGIRIFNKNHQLMENGDTINPGSVWVSSEKHGYPSPVGGLSFPRPGVANQYYFIHLAVLVNNGVFFSPLYYSLIDMNANGGLGRVVEKNKILMEGNIVWPALVKHANGRDWWLLVGRYDNPNMYRFLFSPQGIEGPLEQTTSLQFPEEDGASNSLFSPDGTWYLRGDASNGLNLFSFDRCSGELSNHQFLPEIPGYFLASGSASFSANSNFLYVSDNRATMIQFDLSLGQLNFSTMDTIQQYDLFADPGPPILARYFFRQMGPDGKHYMATSGTTSYMHVIQRPDLPAPLCDVENHGLKLPRYNSNTVCYFPNYRLGTWEGSPCDTLEVQHPPSGFQKTSYEAFLEREARVHSKIILPLPEPLQVSEQKSASVQTAGLAFDPLNPKSIILQALQQIEILDSHKTIKIKDHEKY